MVFTIHINKIKESLISTKSIYENNYTRKNTNRNLTSTYKVLHMIEVQSCISMANLNTLRVNIYSGFFFNMHELREI